MPAAAIPYEFNALPSCGNRSLAGGSENEAWPAVELLEESIVKGAHLIVAHRHLLMRTEATIVDKEVMNRLGVGYPKVA